MFNPNIPTKWASDRLEADIYVVVTLNKSIRLKDGTWVKADKIAYESILEGFLKVLSSRVYGKRVFRRKKLLLRCVSSIEGDGLNKRIHANICFRKPPHVSYADFERMFRETWFRNPWSMEDIYFEQSTGDCVSYSLKEGQGSFLPGASRL